MNDHIDILLVEDNPRDVHLLEEQLADVRTLWAGTDETPDEVELHHGATLEEGLDLLATAPDVVLLDLNLPDSRGFETLRTMLDRVERAPVIVLTGLPEAELGIEAVREGAQDYLVKGEVSIDRFAHAIQYAIERERTERKLRQTMEQLTILNRLLRHDVRNDVSLVVGRAQELEEYIDPRRESLLGEILTSSNHVLQLTRTIGDAMETIVDPSTVDLHAVDVGELLREEVGKARRLYGESAIYIDGDLTAPEVRANRLLSAVFGNLLSNAMLHTETSGPTVEVAVEVTETTVQVAIADRGPGIPDHQKDAVFGRGEQGADSEGLGMGLYLVDRLVDQFGGEVWIEDNEPTGSRFVVELDRVDAA